MDRHELLHRHRDADLQIWDTRRAGEYSGDEATDNRRPGHIPGALNLVWTELLTTPAGAGAPRYLRPRDELAQLVARLGLERDRTIVTYCQSGIRAAFCLFVLELLGYSRLRLYDASMAEWANLTETPLTCGSK